MSRFFEPLPSDCIEYYNIDPARRVLLSQFANGSIDQVDYLASGLPFPIGKLRDDVWENFPASFPDGSIYNNTETRLVVAYKNAGEEILRPVAAEIGSAHTH